MKIKQTREFELEVEVHRHEGGATLDIIDARYDGVEVDTDLFSDIEMDWIPNDQIPEGYTNDQIIDAYFNSPYGVA